jgi:hypothetical protein
MCQPLITPPTVTLAHVFKPSSIEHEGLRSVLASTLLNKLLAPTARSEEHARGTRGRREGGGRGRERNLEAAAEHDGVVKERIEL